MWRWHSLFRKMGMVVAPLHLDVSEVFSSSKSTLACCFVGELFVCVDTFPPLRMRRRFAPRWFGKEILGLFDAIVGVVVFGCVGLCQIGFVVPGTVSAVFLGGSVGLCLDGGQTQHHTGTHGTARPDTTARILALLPRYLLGSTRLE